MTLKDICKHKAKHGIKNKKKAIVYSSFRHLLSINAEVNWTPLSSVVSRFMFACWSSVPCHSCTTPASYQFSTCNVWVIERDIKITTWNIINKIIIQKNKNIKVYFPPSVTHHLVHCLLWWVVCCQRFQPSLFSTWGSELTPNLTELSNQSQFQGSTCTEGSSKDWALATDDKPIKQNKKKQSDKATAFTLYGAYPVKEAKPILCTRLYRGDTGLYRLSFSRIQKRTMEVWGPLGNQLSILWLFSGQLLSTFRSRDLQRYHTKTTDLLKVSHQGKVRGKGALTAASNLKTKTKQKINK